MKIQSGEGLEAATLLYRRNGQLHVTAIAKATFGFVPGDVATPFRPRPIAVYDAFHRDDRRRSVKYPSDLAPYREQVDVVLSGFAYAPGGTAAQATTVQLILSRGSDLLLNKSLLVQASRSDGTPQPFRRIPLEYEYAAYHEVDNPVGVHGAVPNIVALGGSGQAGYAPIAGIWPRRARLLGSFPIDNLRDLELNLPAAFPMDYFQAAPTDQWLDELRGDEWITLVGMTRGEPQFKSRLPGAGVMAGLGGPVGLVKELELDATLLFIDAERKTATITFSGSFPLPEEHWLQTHHIETELFYYTEEDVISTVRKPEVFAATITLEEGKVEAVELPFDTAKLDGRPEPASRNERLPTGTLDESANIKPPSLPFRKTYRRIDKLTETVEVSKDVLRGIKPTPFDESRTAAVPRSASLDDAPSTGTIEIELDAVLRGEVPFQEPEISELESVPPPGLQPPAAPGDPPGPEDSSDPMLHTMEAPASVVLRGMKPVPFAGENAPPKPIGDDEEHEDDAADDFATTTLVVDAGVRSAPLPFAAESAPQSTVSLKKGGLGESFLRLIGEAKVPRPTPRKRRKRRRRSRSA